MIQSFSRHVCTEAKWTTLVQDMESNDTSISRDSVIDYNNALERLMIVENINPWCPKLRSKSRLRTSSLRILVDPSLAAASLSFGPERLLKDLNFMGRLFENLVLRDILVFADLFDAIIYRYRDSDKLEVDIIIEARDGSWAALEVKFGSGQFEDGVHTLKKFLSKLDQKTRDSCRFAGVIMGNDKRFYQKEDGIFSIPLGALGA